jgi:hypothetical protein
MPGATRRMDTTIGPMIDVIMADAAAKEAKKVARVR